MGGLRTQLSSLTLTGAKSTFHYSDGTERELDDVA